MGDMRHTFLKKSKLMLAGAVLAFAFAVVGTVTVIQSQSAGAQSAQQGECDDVNIIRCGLTGDTLAGYVDSFKSFYTIGSDSGNNDLQAVFQWSGATTSSVNAMNTTNTKLGTLYRNGEVKVDGRVVGTDAWVTARFTEGEGFVHVVNNVYARKTTTSFANPSAEVIVHFNTAGQADFAVMVGCGNGVRITPTPPPPPPPPPPPAPIVTCDVLTAVKAPGTRNYKFTVKATVKNTTIESYDFEFSDGRKVTVRTSDTTASTTRSFPEDGKTYGAIAYVNTATKKRVTDDRCRVSVTTPDLTCDLLTFSRVSSNLDDKLTYRFTAHATAKGTRIVSYVFHFGDGSEMTVTTDKNTASTVHKYAELNKTYIAYVEVNGTDEKNVTSNKCKVSVKTPKPEECKPGVPIGSPECEECKPGVPIGSPECEETPPVTPPELPNAGVGNILGLFGASSVIGTLLHRFVLRRRLLA